MSNIKIHEEQKEELLQAFEKGLKELKRTEEETEHNLGRFRVVMTKEVPDRMGEVVDIKGLEVGNFMKNPVVLKNHDHKQMPIGRVERAEVEGDEMIAEGIFAPTEDGQMIRQLWENGFLNSSSIGFMAKEAEEIEGETHITKSELLELSLVTVPANQEALRRTFGEEYAQAMISKGFVEETTYNDKGRETQSAVQFEIFEDPKYAQKRQDEMQEEEKQVDQEKLDKVFENYQEATNMTQQELKNWAETECSQLASQDRSPIERNIRLLGKDKEEWTEQDVEDAKKTISFIARMKQNLGGENQVEDSMGRVCGTKAHIALKNWAFDSKKEKSLIEGETKTHGTMTRDEEILEKLANIEAKLTEQPHEQALEEPESTEEKEAPEGESEEAEAVLSAKDVHQTIINVVNEWQEKYKPTARKHYKRKK